MFMQATDSGTKALDFAEVYGHFSSSLQTSDLPKSVLAAAKLNAELRAILAEKAFSDQLRPYGYVPVGGSVLEFADFLKEDLRITQMLIKDLKLKVE